jgi:hypothetical protein
MQEFDSQHTADSITKQISNVSLGHVLDRAEVSIRIFSLVGTSSQRLRIPMEPSDLPIQNCLYNRPSNDGSQTEPYHGLRAESYVHI